MAAALALVVAGWPPVALGDPVDTPAPIPAPVYVARPRIAAPAVSVLRPGVMVIVGAETGDDLEVPVDRVGPPRSTYDGVQPGSGLTQ